MALHGCGACGGLWLDNASTTQVLARINPQVTSLAQLAAKNASQKADLDASIRCPACNKELRRVPGGDPSLLIDICEEHGTWFDRDELQQVAALAEKRRREQLTAGVAGGAVVAGAAGVAVAGAMAAQQASSGNLAASASDALSNLAPTATDVGATVLETGAEIAVEVGFELIFDGICSLIGGIFDGL